MCGICVIMYADEPSLPDSRSAGSLVQVPRWFAEVHTKTVVHRVTASKNQSPIAVGRPSPCPAVAGVEVAAIESSQLPVRAKSGVRATGMTLVHGQGQGGNEVTAGGHFATEVQLELDSVWAVLEERSIWVR